VLAVTVLAVVTVTGTVCVLVCLFFLTHLSFSVFALIFAAPVRLFTTAASGGAQALGRKLSNGEVVALNVSKAGVPASAAAVSGVYHADRATAANR
jgi:hypothetical protein